VTASYRWEACAVDDPSECRHLGWGTQLVVPHEAIGRRVVAEAQATNAGGASWARSAPTAVVVGAPQLSAPPLLSGAATLRGTLEASSTATGTAPMTVSYAWLRCTDAGAGCTPISGATGNRYAPVVADLQRYVQARVTVTNAYGSDTAVTNSLRITGDGPALERSGRITGDLRVGGLSSYSGALWRDAATTTSWWERCRRPSTECVAVGQRDNDQYVATAADEGSYLRVVERAVNEAGTATSVVTTWEPVRVDPDAIPVVDVRVPTVSAAGVVRFRWTVPTGVVARVEYEVVNARFGRTFGAPQRFVAGSGSTHQVPVRLGETSCLRVRLVADAGAGNWSPQRCTTRPLSARSLRASRGWRQTRVARTTTLRGAVLTTSSRQRVARIAVVARRCRTCGTLQVEVGRTRVGTVNLRGRAGTVTVVLPALAKPTAGTVRLRVTSTRRLVDVRGIALLPATP
jgi:hypothetical protein